jgi:hypothetical protein
LLPDLRWSGPPPPVTAATPPAPDDQRLFLQDFLSSPESGPAHTQGLRPAEGPFPLRDLPRFRSVRQAGMRIVIPPQAGVTRLRVRFSLGLLQREKTEVELLFNGRSVGQWPLTRRGGWVADVRELNALPGENVIEFADVPHQQELDWRGYLERYPDVKLHVITANIPPEEGALEHYELSGRAEGRIMTKREVSVPVRGAYYFVLRELQVEGRR